MENSRIWNGGGFSTGTSIWAIRELIWEHSDPSVLSTDSSGDLNGLRPSGGSYGVPCSPARDDARTTKQQSPDSPEEASDESSVECGNYGFADD